MARHSIFIQGTNQYTNRNRAGRFVRKGVAEWTDSTHTAIRFIDRSSGLKQNARLLVRPWEACYRTVEAPILPPSIEWLRKVGY